MVLGVLGHAVAQQLVSTWAGKNFGSYVRPVPNSSQVVVTLSPGEVEVAHYAGRRRLEEGNKRGRKHRYDPGVGHLAYNKDGAVAELAVCKFLCSFWHGALVVEDERVPGDDGAVEVKSTRWRSGGLVIQPKEPSKTIPGETPAVLVVPEGDREARIAGWALVRDVRVPCYWNDRELSKEPGWLMPQYKLPGTPADLLVWYRKSMSDELEARALMLRGWASVRQGKMLNG